jgi:hypothetical protein
MQGVSCVRRIDSSNTDRHLQQFVQIVPAETQGITVKRVLSVIEFDHALEGHADNSFKMSMHPYWTWFWVKDEGLGLFESG